MSKLSIYIAAPWKDRADMPSISDQLEANGHSISHKWWEEDNIRELFPDDEDEFKRACAQLDFDGVMHADILLLINSGKSEGKAVEQGIAIGHMRPIIAVGKRGEHSQNVFHHLDNYCWVETLDEALEMIGKT